MRRIILLALCLGYWTAAGRCGPLEILKSNPRYFTDGSGKAIYLAGTHNWNNFQDTGHRSGGGDPPPVLDFKGFLDFLEARHHNFFRLWRWETPKWNDDEPRGVAYAQPHPWLRTGPELANDGKPRFDLARFDPAYFERLRRRVDAAAARGMYVSVMLFEGWAVQFLDAWTCHPFNPANNVNQVDADANRDGRGLEYFTLLPGAMGKRVLELQEAYVRKVVDTVNDSDNVLYEIANETGPYATPWQYHMIRFVHQYEAGKPKRHPVGMTFEYRGGANRELFNSPADWISPNRGDPPENYLDDPPANFSGKVVVNDTDHLCGHTCGDNIWVWKSFMRGLNVLFMEELTPSPTWHDSARVAMGQTRAFAGTIDLARMTPHDALASTRYCLARPGFEYLVFQAGGNGEFSVNLSDAKGPLQAEWFNLNADRSQPGETAEGGGRRIFRTPFPGPAALHLKLANAARSGAASVTSSQNDPVRISIDTAAVREPMEIGRHGLGQGGLSDEPMFDGAAVAPLHPKLIRLFVQEYFDVYPRRGEYNWRALDRSVDNILRAGAKPLTSLCIKPAALYPVIDQDRVDPTSYQEWEQLIYQMVRHYNTEKRSGIRYWEVFNEPDIGEDGGCPGRFTPEAYNRYYEHTVRAILRADPAARVGGSALASHRSPLLEGLLKHCSGNSVPLHFVSWHIYNSDPRAIQKTVVSVKQLLSRFPALKCETILNEWNMSLSRPRLEPAFQPAYLIETISRMREAGLDYSCYYHIRDFHVSAARFGRFMSPAGTLNMANWWNLTPQFDGLYDFQGVMRPAWFAFKLLSRLTGNRPEVSGGDERVRFLAAWDEKEKMLETLVWNFAQEAPPARRVNLEFRNLQGQRWRVRRLALDSVTTSNQENDRLRMERNETLEGPPSGDSFELPPYGVALVSLRRLK